MIDWALVSNPSFLAIAAILLFGVPHGGLDGAIARRVGWPSGYFYWILFHAAYLILAAAVALLWWLYPPSKPDFFPDDLRLSLWQQRYSRYRRTDYAKGMAATCGPRWAGCHRDTRAAIRSSAALVRRTDRR